MKLYYESGGIQIFHGDALEVLRTLPDQIVNCCVTSPPYWGLRDYGVSEQLGLEATPTEYVEKMVEIFREVRRVLRDDGTCWIVIGDSYTSGGRKDRDPSVISQTSGLTNRSAGLDRADTPPGLKPKDLVGIPWRLAFSLQADGWWLRSDIIWHKPNPMPESVTDRPTKAHEYLFLLAKSERYYYDAEAIREELTESTIQRDKSPRGRSQNGGGSTESLAGFDYSREGLGNMQSNPAGRNKRSVWTVATQPYPEAHFATFPEKLIEPCIMAGCPQAGTVLDPFLGSGTTAAVAQRLNCKAIGIELNESYIQLAMKRLAQSVLAF